ncbi:MAG: DUF3179 domain-containing protein [Patescibacteria group bacterium]
MPRAVVLIIVVTAAIIMVVAVALATNWNDLNGAISGRPDSNTVSEQNNKDTSDPQSAEKLDPSELEQGCPVRDCIPSIDDPRFVSAKEANRWLNPDDRVFALSYNGVTRAYPQRILNWHEIVNDTLSNDPVAITFCPLCGTAIAFKRVVNGTETTFGVSGKLYNSNLVMYDRLEESYWQQADGQAIIGPAAARNEKLERVPISTITWREWQEKHPETEVLSRETGYTRDYDRYPYGTYEEDNEIYFGIQNSDERLPIKEVVYGFELKEGTKAYTEEVLMQKRRISDTVGDVPVLVTYDQDGTVTMQRSDTGEQIVPLRTFWFAWAAFHPDTTLME